MRAASISATCVNHRPDRRSAGWFVRHSIARSWSRSNDRRHPSLLSRDDAPRGDDLGYALAPEQDASADEEFERRLR
jgi:hypothetical protein